MDQQGSMGTGNRRFALGTVAGVVVGGLLMVGALNLVQPRTANTAVPTASASKTTSTAPSSAAPTSDGSSETPTQSESATPTAPANTPGTPATGTWFALVRWMDKATHTQSEAQAYAASWSSETTPVVVIDTDLVNLRSGKPGQWAIGVVGLSSWSEATAACRVMGLEPGTRCGRYQVV
jgi:cytoskeletal protein RodZ